MRPIAEAVVEGLSLIHREIGCGDPNQKARRRAEVERVRDYPRQWATRGALPDATLNPRSTPSEG